MLRMNVVPPKSHSAYRSEDRQARKDSAAYVSLSSYSLVKQRGAEHRRIDSRRSSTRRRTIAEAMCRPVDCVREREGYPAPLGTAFRVTAI